MILILVTSHFQPIRNNISTFSCVHYNIVYLLVYYIPTSVILFDRRTRYRVSCHFLKRYRRISSGSVFGQLHVHVCVAFHNIEHRVSATFPFQLRHVTVQQWQHSTQWWPAFPVFQPICLHGTWINTRMTLTAYQDHGMWSHLSLSRKSHRVP